MVAETLVQILRRVTETDFTYLVFFLPVRVLVPLDEGEPRGDSLLVVRVVPAEEADEHALLDHHALGEELPRDESVGQAADLKREGNIDQI